MQTSFIGKWEVRGSIRNFHEEIKGFALGHFEFEVQTGLLELWNLHLELRKKDEPGDSGLVAAEGNRRRGSGG